VLSSRGTPSGMDHFAIGGKPFLSRFPPHIPGLFNARHVQEHQLQHDGSEGIADSQAQALQALQAFQLVQAQANQLQAQAQALAEAGYMPSSGTAQPSVLGSMNMPQADVFPSYVPNTSADLDDEADYIVAPKSLHQGYDPSEVQPWEPVRFEVIRKLQDATRNRGQVILMRDTTEKRLVAVKQMPTRWVGCSHAEFVIEHPSETELPWQDVGCLSFLNSVSYAYACQLLGVYRDDAYTYVVTSFATEGDLFSWCEGGVAPGRDRETVVQPIARQIMEGIQQLHDFGIAHRDLSLENILMSKADDDSLHIRIIDFSMASTMRTFRNCIRGKASYQAPELHADKQYDAYLSDAFSLGVTLYAVLLKDYPWLSTRPGGCKCFEYVRKHGFRAYLAKRKLRNSTQKVVEFMSEPLMELLEGLLAFDPASRLTLGERCWASQRRSVWDLKWMHEGPGNG